MHSNLMILMDSIGDLAYGAPLPIWSSHKRNPLESITKGFYWTSPCPGPPGARRRAIVHSCAPPCSGRFAQGTGFTTPASILCTGHRIHEFRLGCSPPVATLGASQQGSSLLVVTMHRAQDRANPTRPPASILCTGQRIHEFRLVTPSILCTGHMIHEFRAGFPPYAQGTRASSVTCRRGAHPQ